MEGPEGNVWKAIDGLSFGDRIRITLERHDRSVEGGYDLEGTFIEVRSVPDNRTVIVKLENGYNIGLDGGRILRVERTGGPVGQGEIEREVQEETTPGKGIGISLISTGGTIASRVDYSTGAVHPAVLPEDILRSLPHVREDVHLKARVLMSVLSEDIRPEDWTALGNAIVEEFRSGSRSCIVTHGTDTLGLTAAALSFLLEGLPGPVVLVGSQRSSDRPSSDALTNMADAIRVASVPDLRRVCVVMHGTVSDGTSLIHRGTRVRKMHTSRRDAFRSINEDPLGRVVEGEVIMDHQDGPVPEEGPKLVGGFDEKVNVFKAVPQADPALLEHIGMSGHALVIEGTGLGHIRSDLVPVVRRLVASGRPVVMTSSCISGMVNLNVYSSGRRLLEAGAVPAQDMLPETAMVKTMWVLHRTWGPDGADMDAFRELFLKDIAGEVSGRTVVSAYGVASENDDGGSV